MFKRALTIFIGLALALAVSAQKIITFDDLYSYPQIESFSLSPDGKYIAAEVTEYDPVTDIPSTNIWIVPVDGGGDYQLTNGGDDCNPIWSPDGEKIAFISTRGKDGLAQIWLISPEGGEAFQLTDIYTELSNPVWSKDSKYLLATSMVHPHCDSDDCNREKDEEAATSKVKAKLYEDLLFRHYKWWSDGKRNHVFLIDAQTGIYSDLTPFDKDAPPIAGSGKPGYDFAKQTEEIAFVMNTDTVIAVSTNNDVFTLNIKTNHLTRISTSPGYDDNPVYSPDGRSIIYTSMSRAGYEADQRDLILYDRISKTYDNLTEDFDRSVGEIIWGPYSKYIYFTAVDGGISKIYILNLKTRKITTLVEDGVCWNIRISGNGLYLYYTKSTDTQPYEIYEYNSKNKMQTRLTHFSDEHFKDLELKPAEDFQFTGAKGDDIHGRITYPPHFKKTSKYPLVLLIHGGPQWCWLKDFNYYGWNTQLMAAQGYITVQIDPHGSRGYGQDFVDAVNNDWGGAPYEDLMLGLDYLLAKYDFVDSTKMAALGRSYGGYMTNWICSQTDRFACLVTIDGGFENISDYYSTEELWFPNWDFGGPPWESRDNYLKHSPAEYVRNFNTPTLIVHSQLDYRVDISQGIMMFTALRARSVPAQFLYFPDEGHTIRKLHNIRHCYKVQFEWLAKYLK